VVIRELFAPRPLRVVRAAERGMCRDGREGRFRTAADLQPEQIRSDAIRASPVQSSYRNQIEIAPKTKGQATNNDLSLFRDTWTTNCVYSMF